MTCSAPLSRRRAAAATFASLSAVASASAPAHAAAATEAEADAAAVAQVRAAYDGYAATYDVLNGGAAADAFGLPAMRLKLLAKARGRVLEVAVGTGLNLPAYDVWRPGGRVSSVEAIDLSEEMLVQARTRIAALAPSLREAAAAAVGATTDAPAAAAPPPPAALPVALKRMDVGQLEYPDGAFDTVVSTFALCTMTSPLAALSEMRRVCRAPPRAGGDARDGGGRVLLLEHTRSDFGPLAAYQDATASLIAPVAKGCVWNQDVEALAAQAGLRILSTELALAGTVRLIVATPSAVA